MNHPVGCVDPDGYPTMAAWERLTAAERKILAPKLVASGTDENPASLEPQTPAGVFNENFSGAKAGDVPIIVTGVKNFIDNAGARSNSEVWQQVSSLIGAWSGRNDSAGIAFHVRNRLDFLEVLRQSGEYDVDARYERLNVMTDHVHSVRFITETSYQPGMHFIQEKGYADTRFDVHWDPRSAAFRAVSDLIGRPFAAVARNLERARAGLSHKHPKSSAQTRLELRQMGIVPGRDR